MNNNNFALLRYFRDLGIEAYLLLYANDGQGTLSHFKPECDTWNIRKWESFIHQTDIPNAPVAAIDFPLSWFMAARSRLRAWFGLQDGCVSAVSRKQIRNAYAEFDRLVASGISPATLLRINQRLDIFYPYASRVEFLGTGEFVSQFASANKLTNVIYRKIVDRQARGIKTALYTLNYEMGVTHDTLCGIGVSPQKLAIPMVYNNEQLPNYAPTEYLGEVAKLIASTSFSLLHQSRLMWKNTGNYSEEDWRYESKNTQWLIHAFAEFVGARPELNPLLFMVEYGPDVKVTKNLAMELGIVNRIKWLPKMERRELMWLLSRVTIGCGEFYDVPRMIWGGTGWEALASGKPLLQGFNFEPGEFEWIYGYPQPSMLPVRKQDDILSHLLEISDNPKKCEEIGRGAKKWFNQYNGIGLAKQWLDLLMTNREGAPSEKQILKKQGVRA
tara:strand:- start:132409 stop:133737 length:1329 start_codon:yes stop_codon:yes gene_type:complete